MTTDPTVVQQVTETLHSSASSLLERLDNLEKSGMLGPEAADASRGWRARLGGALHMFKVHVMGQGETSVSSETMAPPAEEETEAPAVEAPAEEAPAAEDESAEEAAD